MDGVALICAEHGDVVVIVADCDNVVWSVTPTHQVDELRDGAFFAAILRHDVEEAEKLFSTGAAGEFAESSANPGEDFDWPALLLDAVLVGPEALFRLKPETEFNCFLSQHEFDAGSIWAVTERQCAVTN